MGATVLASARSVPSQELVSKPHLEQNLHGLKRKEHASASGTRRHSSLETDGHGFSAADGEIYAPIEIEFPSFLIGPWRPSTRRVPPEEMQPSVCPHGNGATILMRLDTSSGGVGGYEWLGGAEEVAWSVGG